MNLPTAFLRRTKNLLGDEYDMFERSLRLPPVVSVRFNNKVQYQPPGEKVPWCDNAYYLEERPLFTADPLFHAGTYYVQEASSMFLFQVAEQYLKNARIVLDLCAAPGGKSTLLSQSLPDDALLVSNEIIYSRAHILAENMIKWGSENVVVTSNKAEDFSALPGYFDAVVVDAPCSGEGMFRKDKNAIDEWSEQSVEKCARRQREILSDVWDTLKTNGILIYSTCTYNREENEDNVDWICNELDAEVLDVDLKGIGGVAATGCGYRFYPHKTRGEGFFISVLRKKDYVKDFKNTNKPAKKGLKSKKAYNEISAFSLLSPEEWIILSQPEKIKAFRSIHINDFLLLNNQLNCIHSGITLGEMKGRNFVPDISAALSKRLDLNSVQKTALDYQTAVSYLKKEAVYIPDAAPGYILMTYRGQPLGWVKNVGNRCNNMYPAEWRIRMDVVKKEIGTEFFRIKEPAFTV